MTTEEESIEEHSEDRTEELERELNSSESPYHVTDPVLSLIGDTPLIKYPRSGKENLHIKLEMKNPTGSMKDRIALGMVLEMRQLGKINANDLIVEASSGNTAGSVSLVANRLGYDCVITIPESTSKQKSGYIESFGSELIKCPNVGSNHRDHYRNKAKRIANKRDGVLLDQYHNQLNPQVHEKWTAPELWEQTNNLTHVVCPMGTGGTISGIGKYMSEKDNTIEIIGVDAEHSNISTAFHNEDLVEYDTSIEGLGKECESPTMWFEYIDSIISVSDETAVSWTKRAAMEDGLLIGTSTGAALKVAYEISERIDDSSVVVIACDSGNQYFETITA